MYWSSDVCYSHLLARQRTDGDCKCAGFVQVGDLDDQFHAGSVDCNGWERWARLPQPRLNTSPSVVAMRSAKTRTTTVLAGMDSLSHRESTTSRTPKPAGAPGVTKPISQLDANAPVSRMGLMAVPGTRTDATIHRRSEEHTSELQSL